MIKMFLTVTKCCCIICISSVRKMLCIPWTKLLTNKHFYNLAKTEKELLLHVKSRKLRYFRQVTRPPHNTIESSMLDSFEVVGRGGWPRISWLNNISMWTCLSGDGLLHAAQDRAHWGSSTYYEAKRVASKRIDLTWFMMPGCLISKWLYIVSIALLSDSS